MSYSADFFDRGVDRRGTRSIKWDRPAPHPPGAIPLWVADMDFPCAQPVREALEARARHGVFGYTYAGDELYEALTGFWRRRHGVEIQREQLLPLPSVVAGLHACVRALSRPGEGVILQPPVYGPFFSAILDAGRVPLEAPLLRGADGVYAMDLNAVEGQLKAGARLMILCSPHNPVSRLWTAGELEELSALLDRYGAVLVSDEIHADFAWEPAGFVSALSLPPGESGRVCLLSPSKTFNIAGLKQAFLVCADPALRKTLDRHIRGNGLESENIFALEACRAAYALGGEWLDGLRAYLLANRALLLETLARELPDAGVTPVEATFLAWVDIRAYGRDNAAAAEACLQAGVIPSEGGFFGKEAGEGFMRLNFGCPSALLSEGLRRFASAVKNGPRSIQGG